MGQIIIPGESEDKPPGRYQHCFDAATYTEQTRDIVRTTRA